MEPRSLMEAQQHLWINIFGGLRLHNKSKRKDISRNYNIPQAREGRMLQVDSAWVSRTVSQAHLPNLQQLVSTDSACSGDKRGIISKVWLSQSPSPHKQLVARAQEERRVHWPLQPFCVSQWLRLPGLWIIETDFEWKFWKLEAFEWISSKTGHWSL